MSHELMAERDRADRQRAEDRKGDADRIASMTIEELEKTCDLLNVYFERAVARFRSDGDELEIRAEIAIVDYLYDKVDARISALEAQS